jgi:hypothetical protein
VVLGGLRDNCGDNLARRRAGRLSVGGKMMTSHEGHHPIARGHFGRPPGVLELDTRFQVHALLKEHHVPLRYSEADLEDDLSTHRKLGILPV